LALAAPSLLHVHYMCMFCTLAIYPSPLLKAVADVPES